MNTMRIVSLLLLLALTPHPSGAQWRACSPVYQTGVAYSVVTLGTRVIVGTSSAFFLSTDYGSTWNRTGYANAWVWSFAVSGTTVFASTVGNGIYRSTDAGSTWQSANNGVTSYTLWYIASNGTSVFSGGSGGQVFRSTDNGDSWVSVSTGLPSSIVAGIACVGTNIYAMYRSGEVYQSTDNGTSWTLKGTISVNPRTLYAVGTKLFAGSSGSGAFSSTDNGSTWTSCAGLSGGVRSFAGTASNLLAGTSSGVFRSTDNGASWTPTSASWVNGLAYGLAQAAGSIFAATDMGLAASADNGASWTMKSQTWFPVTFQTLTTNGSTVFGGDGGLYTTTDLGATWTATTVSAVALLVSGGNIFAGTSGNLVMSTNNGVSWANVESGLATPFSVYQNALAGNGNNIFVGTTRGTYLSTNNGTIWTPVNTGLVTRDSGASSFAFIGSTVFAGTFDRGVYRSTNNGASWSAVNVGLADTSIYALGSSGSTLFAGTQSGGIFTSTNNGAGWTAANKGLTSNSVNAFLANGSQVYAAMLNSGGVCATNNNGLTWAPAGLNGLSVGALTLVGGDLVAAADQNAYWRPLSEMSVQAITFQADLSQLLLGGFNPATDSIMLEGSFNGWNAVHKMTRVGTTSLWQEVITTSGSTTDSLEYKFRVLPSYKYSNDGWEPGGNHVVHLTGSDQTLPPINPVVTLVPSIQNDVTVTFEVDLNGAHEVYGNTTITGLQSVWMAGDNNLPLAWPPNNYTFADTVSSLVRLYDNGTHGDPAAGDGIWSTTVTFRRTDIIRKIIQYKFVAVYPGVQSLNSGNRYLDNEFADGTNRLLTLVDSTGALPMGVFQKFGAMGSSAVIPVPASPSGLQATVNSATQITIKWTDNAPNEDGFRVESKIGSGGLYGVVATTGANVATFQHSGLNASTQYSYRVRAYNGGGNSPYSNEVTATTFPNPAPPIATTGLATSVNTAGAVLNASVNPNYGATTYSFDWGTTTSYGSKTTQRALAIGGTAVAVSETLATLTPNSSYHFRIVAVNSAGTTNGADQLFSTLIDSIAPPSPVNMTVAPASWSSTNLFTVSWTNPLVPTGVSKAWYTIDVPPSVGAPGTAVTLSGSGNPSIQVVLPSVGNHAIYCYLENGVGKKNPSCAITVVARFDNILPVVTHDSTAAASVTITSTGALQGTPPGISASASDANSGLRSLVIGYKRTSDANWTTQTFASSGVLQIPAMLFTSTSGVEYEIVAIDSAGNVTNHSYSIAVQLQGSATSPSTLLPAASSEPSDATQLAYRMFSVPYDLPDKTPQTVLSSLGPHAQNNVNYVNWRLWRMDQTPHDYEDFKTENAFQPGKAYFLIVNDANKTLTVAPGGLVSARQMYETGISLNAGWNSVGNPFPFDLSYDSLFTVPANAITGRAYFSGTTTGTNGWEVNGGGANTLRTWGGLAIKLGQTASLHFRTGMHYLGKQAGTFAGPPVSPVTISERSTTSCLFSFNAVRLDNRIGDHDLVFGFADNLPNDASQYNWPHPPMVIERGVSVCFTENGEELMHDIHAPAQDGDTWPILLRTGDAGARIQLEFRNIEALISGWHIYLLDLDERTAYDLRHQPSMAVNSKRGTRTFRIIAGTKDFTRQNSSGIELVPSAATLSQNYPNPFNPATSIRYAVPDASSPLHVELRVYNILGQQVAVLVDGPVESGYYEVEFNGRSLASGMYLCRLQVTGRESGRSYPASTRRMVLLK